jgi:hypothetical protein
MTQRAKCLISSAVLLFTSLTAMAQGTDNGNGVFRVHLYMDRLSFSEGDPVMLNIVVKNTSVKKEFYVVYDAPCTTYQPVVYSGLGREAETTVPYRVMNRRVEEVIGGLYPRTVEIMPNETLVHSIDLRSIYKLERDTEYRVRAYLFPDVKQPASVLSDNILGFKIVRAHTLVRKSGVVREQRGISPAEVVTLALTAERSENWDNLLKYIKQESFISAFPEFARLYDVADDVEKLKIIEDFNKFVTRQRIDYIKDFTVLTETVSSDGGNAYVDVMVKRYGARRPFFYKYHYTLERFRDFWLIIDLEATVAKGEQQ